MNVVFYLRCRPLLGLCLGLLVFVSADAPAQGNTDRILTHVQSLTSEILAGRGAGTAEAQATVDTLIVWLEAANLKPAFSGQWTQTFPLAGTDWSGADLEGRWGHNVAGLIPGRGDLASRYLIIGAHFDHLGRTDAAPENDTVPARGQYYPGANDNASGLAVLVELATHFAGRAPVEHFRSLLFVAFGAEEVGLQGSRYLIDNPPVDLALVDLMINFDTVGQVSDNTLYVSGVGTSPGLNKLVTEADMSSDLNLILAQGGFSGSDHTVFISHHIPALFLFSGPYPQYNRPSDDWPTLNLSGLVQTTNFAAAVVQQAAAQTVSFPYISVKAAGQQIEATTNQNRDTWFGSMPDFADSGQGYKLAGVLDNSPAARAGLQKGDVLVGMAGQTITDLPTFTRVLRSHNPGDVVEITILRKARRLKYSVVLGNRQDRK